jgi:prolyl oligopeptidase
VAQYVACAAALRLIGRRSIAWTHDNRGFFYCRYPAPELKGDADEKRGTETASTYNQKVYQTL